MPSPARPSPSPPPGCVFAILKMNPPQRSVGPIDPVARVQIRKERHPTAQREASSKGTRRQTPPRAGVPCPDQSARPACPARPRPYPLARTHHPQHPSPPPEDYVPLPAASSRFKFSSCSCLRAGIGWNRNSTPCSRRSTSFAASRKGIPSVRIHTSTAVPGSSRHFVSIRHPSGFKSAICPQY